MSASDAELQAASLAQAHEVLAQRFAMPAPESVGPLGSGLINDTFAVRSDNRELVLQRVHPVFAPENHHNIVAVTERLQARGLRAPTLLRTTDGEPWTEYGGRPWRLMTRLPGVTFDAATTAGQTFAAAAALGAFHHALEGLEQEHTFVGLRLGVHDTPQHLQALRSAVEDCADHRLADQVLPLAASILEAAGSLPDLAGLPQRVMHGDPKLNNVVFAGPHGAERERAVGLIDLDTVAPMALHLELGDAWRSWCNPKGEDEAAAQFDLEVFEASLRGYASVGLSLTPEEREALVYSVEVISLELAARFAADALRESYFGWNAARYASRGHHNLVRAQGQWSLHAAVAGLRSQRAALLRGVLAV